MAELRHGYSLSYPVESESPRGVVLDLDGPIWKNNQVSADAIDLVATLRQFSIPFAILTNDCSISRASLVEDLASFSLVVDAQTLLTPSVIFAEAAVNFGIRSIAYVGSTSAAQDLQPEISLIRQGLADAVVIGDVFDDYNREQLDYAARLALRGVPVYALQRKYLWSDDGQMRLDVGFWVAGFEAATATAIQTVGKPAPGAYRSALQHIGLGDESASHCWMVSDQVEPDLNGAAQFGLRTVLVSKELQNCNSLDSIVVKDLGQLSDLIIRFATSKHS